ncbi:MAG TPA: universal stress protein [Polyangiaceae bacterium]|nr:universal stress protein [Polyangiaceae bacterium]
MQAFKNILVATDFSSSSERALELAVKLATKFEAKLTLLHVWEVPVYPYMDFVLSSAELMRNVEQAAEHRLSAALRELQERIPAARSLLKMGVPWEQILATAKEEQVDVIVMGTHGRRGVEHFVLGSVAEKVVRLAPVPVLTARSKS